MKYLFEKGKDNPNYSHGLSRTSIYTRWATMMSRCYNKKSKKYPTYGGRGIKVCFRWHNFHKFFYDMGHPPEGHSLDRIDSNGHYEPVNCRWATQKAQQRNRRDNLIIEFYGEKKSLAEWCEIMNKNYKIVGQRIRRGWTIEKAFKGETE